MGVTRDLITLSALDGQGHDALFHHDERLTRVRARRTGRRTAQIHIHGVMGNFLVGTLRFLPAPYAALGLPMLVPETRMGNVGQLFGHAIFDDAMLDLDAAVRWLSDREYDGLILSGYSSGATMAVRYAATRDLPQLRGVVLYGAPWGLPQSHEQRCRRWGSDPSYDDVLAMVRRHVADDPDARLPDRMFVIHQSRGPDRSPRHSEVYTWRTWWHTRGPNAVAAMTFRNIADVTAPILLVQGDADQVVAMDEAERLQRVAHAAGNAHVELLRIPGADHFFAGHEAVVTQAVGRRLRAWA
jgi:alpha-beta hydrolase superfamily lysophospholipase